VPLHLVQDLSRSTNNNIEHQSLEFVMYTMLPWFKRWEEAINAQLLTAQQRLQGYYIEFKIAALLRGDAKSRAEAYAVGRQWGWLSVNDIRRLENMNSIGPAGDIYLEPLNMHEAGKPIEQPNNNAATKAMAEEIFKMIEERRI
jgi:phage portal protein BeeE